MSVLNLSYPTPSNKIEHSHPVIHYIYSLTARLPVFHWKIQLIHENVGVFMRPK